MDYQSLREHRELIKARESAERSDWRNELQEEGEHPYVDVMPQTNKVEDKKKKKAKEVKEGLAQMAANALGNPPPLSAMMRLKQGLIQKEIDADTKKNAKKHYSGKAQHEQLDADFLMDVEVEQLDEILGLGKKPTPEEAKAKKLKQLERLYKVAKDPNSDVARKKKPVKVVQREEVEPVEEENKELEAQGQKVAELERQGRGVGITSKFRKEHPGSRQPKKVPGAKETEGEAANRRRGAQAQRAAKYGLTSKEKGETQARDKYYSARD